MFEEDVKAEEGIDVAIPVGVLSRTNVRVSPVF